ncbi:MAG: ROK family protein [Burkholderiales bacterium]|nr:ROK family protein [Burkholderiales bacterium]
MHIGVDLGGAKSELIALDPAGAGCLRQRVPTPRSDYAAALDAIVALVDDARRKLDAPVTIGIGTPAAWSSMTGATKNANSTTSSLGGGLSNAARRYTRVPALWQALIFSDAIQTGLVRNRHGDSSGVRGVAWLWPAIRPGE